MAAAIAAYDLSESILQPSGDFDYLSVDDCVLAIDNDLARSRNHERGHHGGRLLSE